MIDARGSARGDLSRESGRRPARHLPPGEPDRRGDRLGARVHRSGCPGALDLLRPRGRGRCSRTKRSDTGSTRSSEPLQPGDSLQLSFDVSFQPRGFPNSGIPTDVVGNGAHFNRTLAAVHRLSAGVRAVRRLRRASASVSGRGRPCRARATPAARQVRNSIQRRGPRSRRRRSSARPPTRSRSPPACCAGAGRRTGDATSTTRPSADVVRRHRLLRESTTCSRTGGTDVDARAIFHHPAHAYVLDRMVRSMKASLEYYTEQFGPYPDSQLRIVEIPRYGGFGLAHPHTIAFTEDIFFSRVKEGEVDQPFYGTAHEIAHQWWGGQVRGAVVRGRGFLSESLANYSAMMVTEKTYGPEAARRVYDFQMERYLRGRADQSREVPVLEVEDQPYIAYRKGAIAMYTLREHIGEERGQHGAAPLPREISRRRSAVPDLARSLRRAARGHPRLAAVPARGPLRERHALGRQDRAGERGADRHRRVPGDARRGGEEDAGRQRRQGDRGADGRPGRDRRLRGRRRRRPRRAALSASSTASGAASRRSASPFRGSRPAPASIPTAS